MAVKFRGSDKIPGIPIHADTSPAYAEVDKFISDTGNLQQTVKFDANFAQAEGRLKRFLQTKNREMFLDVKINDKSIDDAAKKAGSKQVPLDAVFKINQESLKGALNDAKLLSQGVSAAMSAGLTEEADRMRATLRSLFDEYGDLKTIVGGKVVSGLRNILDSADDLSSLGNIAVNVESLERAEELTAKILGNEKEITKELTKQEKKDLWKKLNTFTGKIKRNLSGLSTSDMREVLGIVSKLKDTVDYGKQVEEIFGNIAATFVGIGEVTGLQEVVDEFENSASALRNVDWGFGKLHDRNQLIEDQKEIIGQLKQIGKLRAVSTRTRSGDFSEGKIDIFDGDFAVDELETRIALLESLRDNINELAVLTKAKKITLFDDSIYHPENIVYAIGRAISSAQAQFPAIDEYDVPSAEDLLKQFDLHVDSLLDRDSISESLQFDIAWIRNEIKNYRTNLEDAISDLDKYIEVDKFKIAWDEMTDGLDLPHPITSRYEEFAANIRNSAMSVEYAIEEARNIINSHLDARIPDDYYDDIDGIFDEVNEIDTGAIEDVTASIEKQTKAIEENTEAVDENLQIKNRVKNLVDTASQIPQEPDTTRFVHFTREGLNQSILDNGLRLENTSLAETVLYMEQYVAAAEDFSKAASVVKGVAGHHGLDDNAIILDIPNDSIDAYINATGRLETISKSFVKATVDTKNGLYTLNDAYDASHDVVEDYTEAIREAQKIEEGITSRRPGLKRSESLEAMRKHIQEKRGISTSDLLNSIADSLDKERKNVEKAADSLAAARKGVGQAYSGDVYHGSKVPLDNVQYDPSKGTGWRNLGTGLYVTPDLELATTYGENIVKKSVALKNVFMLTEDFITNIDDLYAAMGSKKPDNATWDTITAALSASLNTKSQIKNFTKRMRQMGYDGMYSKGYGFGDKSVEQLAIYDEDYWKNLTTIPAATLKALEQFDADKESIFAGYEPEKYGQEYFDKFKSIYANIREKIANGLIGYEEAYVELANESSQAWSAMQSQVKDTTQTVRKLSTEQRAKMFDGASIKSLLDAYHIGKDDQNEIYDEFDNLGNMVAAKMDVDDIEEQKSNIVALILKSAKNEVETGLESFFEELTSGKIYYDSKEIGEIGKNTFADIKGVLSSYKLLTPNREKGLRADEHFHGLSDFAQDIIKYVFEKEYNAGFNGSKASILQGIAAVIKNAPSKFTGLSADEQEDLRMRTAGIVDKVVNNVEHLLQAEQKVTAEIEEQNEARETGVKRTKKDSKGPVNVDILEKSVDDALAQLRRASDNKTAFIDLTDVHSAEDLENKIRDMAQLIVGSDLKIDSVIEQDGIARVTLYNEQLGITAAQMWRLQKATEDANEAQLELISETRKHSPRAAKRFSDAQQKKIANDNRSLIAQMSKLDTLERTYKYSNKKINGNTLIDVPDSFGVLEDADKTVDGFISYLRNQVSNAMDGGLTEGVKNGIANGIRILENGIKVQQLQQYASTTMKPTELEDARKELGYTLDALEAKARKNNVFSQISEDFDGLRARLTDPENKNYIKDATGISDFVDSLRVTRSKLGAEISNEQEIKGQEQAFNKLLNLQERLYKSKKEYVALEIGEESKSDLLAAERKTEELQQQYDTSLSLLRSEEDYYIARQRELKLEEELKAAIDDQLEAREKIARASKVSEEAKIAEQTATEIGQYDQRIQAARAELDTFARWQSDIKNIGMLSDETAHRIRNLGDEINNIDGGTDVEKLASEFKSLKSEVTYETTKSKANKNRIAEIKASLDAQKQELKALYGQLDLDIPLGDNAQNAQDIKQSYTDAMAAIEKCTQAIGEQTQEEIASATASANAAKIKMDAYKEMQDQFETTRRAEEQRTGDGAIKQYYQTLNSTIQQIANLDSKINNLKLKDDGSGAWTPIIDSLDMQREQLLEKVRETAYKINDAFSDGFAQGANKIELPFSSILQSLKDENASQVIQDFFNDFRVQGALTDQSIGSFVSNIQNAQNKAEEFATVLAERLSVVSKSAKTLSDLGRTGAISTDHELYKGGLDKLASIERYKSTLPRDPTAWSAEQTVTIQRMANDFNEYVSALDRATSKEKEYFASKKQYANIANVQDYDKMSASLDQVSNSTNRAKEDLEKFVSGFTDGRGIITGFTTSADGISRIDFSVLEEGTGYLRNFSSEMGSFTSKVYTYETSMNNMTAGTKAAQAALSSMSQVMSRLNSYGLTTDNNEYVNSLYERMQSLSKALASMGTSKNAGDQNTLQNMATDANRLIKTLLSLETAYLKVKDGDAGFIGSIKSNEDAYEKMTQFAKEIAATMPGSTLSIDSFNSKTKELTYTIEGVNNEAKTFTMTIDTLSGSVTTQLKSIGKVKTGWQEFAGILGGSIGKGVRNFATFFLSTYDIVRYLRNGFNEVLEIDTAMTELKKVTEETDVAYSNFLESSYQSAKKIGSTMKDFTQATADFARLGYDLEEASMLAEAANVYMNVGDGIEDVSTASESIISTMKAFNVEAEDSMGIVDRFNEVGNNFAIDSVGIGDALQRSASALAEAGNTIDESIALVTGANTVVQNPEQVGTALKTLALRLRGAKVELEEAGLETDNMAESTATLQAKLKALTHGRVDIMEDADTFKSTTQILREMADAWEYMTDIERASALELMGGKRQANILSSLINNFDIVEDVIQTSLNSENSAIEENAKYLDSMQGRIDQLTNSMQAMWVHAMDSDFLKFLISAADVFVQLTDKVGLFNAAIAVFMGKTAFGGKKFGVLNWLTNKNGTISTADSVDVAESKAQDADTAATERNTAATNANIQAEQRSAQASMNSANADNAEAQAANAAAAADTTEAGTSSAEAAAENASATASAASGAADAAEAAQSTAAASADAAENVVSNAEAAAEAASAAGSIAAGAADAAEASQSTAATVADSAEIIVSAQEGITEAASGAASGMAAVTDAAQGAASGITILGATLKAGTLGFKLFNAAATMGVSLLVGAAISAIFKFADEFIVTSEEIQEAANQAQSAIESLSTGFKDTEKFVSANAKRFAELAQGVDMLTGKNLSLTTDDYEEFLDLSNQLADIFPTLSRSYDENGNAIVQLSGDADTMVGSLKELLDIQRQITNQQIAENIPDLYAGVKLKSDDFSAELDKLETESQSYQDRLNILQTEVVDTINNLFDTGTFEIANDDHGLMLAQAVRRVLSDIGISINDFIKKDAFGNTIGYTYKLGILHSDEEIEEARGKIASGVDALAAEYATKIDGLNTEIQTITNKNKANWSSVLSSIASWLATDPSYKALNDDMQAVVQTMVSNIDFSKLDDVDTWEGMQSYIQENIISKIQKATPEVQEAFAKLFKIKTDGKTTKGYIDAIKKQAQQIADSSDFTYDEVLKNTGYQDIINQYETSASNILKVLDDNIPKSYEKYAKGTKDRLTAFREYSHEVDILKDKIYSLSPDEVTRAFDIIKKYGINTWDELVEALENKTFDVVVDLDTEKTGMDNLLAAIDESVSATGLSAESVANLKARYQDLENYDPARLFETTANGIHLNTQALGELEKAYEKQNKDALDDKLESLTEHYNDLTLEIQNCEDASERALLYAQRSNVIDQINDTAALAAQYAGLTSAYNKWQNAQSSGGERDMYEGVLSGKAEMDEEISRGWIDDGTRAYLELLSGQDLSTAPYEKVLEVYKQLNKEIGNSGYNVFDFFTQDENGNSTTEGIFNFFDAVMAKQKELGENWITIGKDGSYSFDFGVNGDKAIAEAMGISEELVQIILRAARDAGFDINLDSAYSELAYLEDEAKAANDKLKELGATEYTFNINSTDIDDVENQIAEAKKALDHFRNEDGSVNVDVEGAEEAQMMLATLIYQKQTLDTAAVLYVNTANADSNIETTVQKMQEFKAAYNEFEVKAAVGADTTEAEAHIQEVINSFSSEEKEILVGLGIDLTKTNQEINAAINAITVDQLIEFGLDTTLVDQYTAQEHTTKGEVVWENNTAAVTAWMAETRVVDGTVEWGNDITNVQTHFTATGTINWSGTGGADGTAHSHGTAFAGGSWGAKKTETSLVGELGPEILVRNGRWQTIGENGAEFTQIKKGDIIFNHKQTEELLKNGYVTGRGKAYASGTAYSDGAGPGRFTVTSAVVNSNGTSLAEDAQDAANEFKEAFDWIEVRLEEINEDLDLKNARLENAIGASNQNAIIDDMIEVNEKLYENLIAGSNEYYEFAAKLLEKVPEEYRQAAQDGSIAIEEFVGETDEETLEAIKEYREWVQKGADATQQAEETLTEISNLAKQAIDNIAADFENKTSLGNSRIEQLEAYNELLETDKGYESTSIYQAMIDENKASIKILERQRNAMQAELNKRVESGEIKVNSDAWYEAVNDIAAVDTEIINLQTDNENLQDSINQLHWDKFDSLISRLESVSGEAENLIDILSNEDMVDESGNWTDEGLASLGLHAQRMEAAEVQAKKFADEIAYLDKNWKKLGYTEDEYLEKRDELKEGQYDAIKSYHDEKDAIVDLNKERVDAIKEGIEKEIEAYQELIEKKKEELDAEKDLYDFQKDIADQQKGIADLERKLAALSTDNSASARAQRARLEAELAEARAELQDKYYDRSISDQQNALDQELENFQEEKDKELEGWDEYLENTEQVVSDSLSTIQTNTELIYNTLQAMGEEYGLSITESLTSPWQEGENAIQSFSEKFGISMSATVEELKELELEFKETMLEIEHAGVNAANTVRENAQGYTEAEYQGQANNGDSGGGSDSSDGNSSTAGLVSSLSEDIQYGNTGSNVKKLQQALNELGYGNSGTSSLDGIFGQKTLEAVKKFQSAMNIDDDGVVGPETKKKFELKGYAKGSKSINKDQWSIIDELGDELRLIPDGNGRLAYMKKGTGVVPADLTANLMEWGKLDPANMLERNKPQISVSPSVINNTTEINIDASVGELLHVEHLDGNNPAEISKIVDKAWDKHMKELNAHVRRYTNR